MGRADMDAVTPLNFRPSKQNQNRKGVTGAASR